MAYDGWVEFNDTELFNLSRTAQLAEAMGLEHVWTDSVSVQWIQDALSGVDYDLISEAPWYDPDHLASSEFAGLVPLSFRGLDDSTRESTPVEFTTDGGNPGRARNATLPIVASVAIVAMTDRGAEFGKRWLDRLLRGTYTNSTCSGSDLTYFRYADEEAPKAHRRNVKLTRGTSVTRKRSTDCSVTWLVTFTLTCADPYEYGEAVPMLSELGGVVEGPELISDGSVALIEEGCPVFNYDPIVDPSYPALVPSPTAPNLLPTGWGIEEGMTFDRFWARVTPPQPSNLLVVPRITLTSTPDSRMVRVSIWPSDATEFDQCDPLFSVVVSYLPPGVDFIIDGEQQASYAWDGFSPQVRRTDSLVYSPSAGPVQWTSFNDSTDLLVTLDTFAESGFFPPDVRASLELIPKSD